MKIYSHSSHWYDDSARHVLYKFGPDGVYDVDPETANYMLAAHPDKFCRLEDNSSLQHVCTHQAVPELVAASTGPEPDYTHREMKAPPDDRQMTLRTRARQRKPR